MNAVTEIPSITLAQAIPGMRIDDCTIAGIVLNDDGSMYAVGKLDAKAPKDRMTFKEALDWALSIGADGPTRKELALFWVNLAHLFEERACWSKEPLAGDPSGAWCQDFHDGDQWDYRKSGELLAVAVRRFPIQ